jgi:hypothetical protein
MKSQVRGVADQIPTDSEDDAKQVRAALNAISDILGAIDSRSGPERYRALRGGDLLLYPGKWGFRHMQRGRGSLGGAVAAPTRYAALGKGSASSPGSVEVLE